MSTAPTETLVAEYANNSWEAECRRQRREWEKLAAQLFDDLDKAHLEIHRLRARNEVLERELDLSDLRLDSVERAGFLAR